MKKLMSLLNFTLSGVGIVKIWHLFMKMLLINWHNKNLVIAKIDATAKDVEGIDIEGFPTIIFYQKSNKQNPIHFDGDRGEEAIIDFWRKHGTIFEHEQKEKLKKTSDDL